MNRYLTVFGHTALDILLRVPKLPESDTSVAVNKRIRRYGGTGANIARASAEMDVNVSLASFVGRDFPEDYHDALKNSGVSLRGLKKMEEFNTPRCWIVNDGSGDQITLIDQGVMKEAQRFDPPRDIIEGSDILHIGTGKPAYYKKVYEHIVPEEKMIVLDPAQELEYLYEPAVFKEFLQKSDCFFCNSKEKEVALRYLSADSMSESLERFDLSMVLVTEGSNGSTLYLPDDRIHIPAYEPKKFIEATGAGDAFRAGFYAALSRDRSLEECCRIGSARASFALEHEGGQGNEVSWEKVISRMEREST